MYWISELKTKTRYRTWVLKHLKNLYCVLFKQNVFVLNKSFVSSINFLCKRLFVLKRKMSWLPVDCSFKLIFLVCFVVIERCNCDSHSASHPIYSKLLQAHWMVNIFFIVLLGLRWHESCISWKNFVFKKYIRTEIVCGRFQIWGRHF